MPDRPRLPLPFGAGLDRTTGNFAAPPGTFRDLRNVVLKEGKAVMRQGFSRQVSLAGTRGNETDIVGIALWKAASRGIVVGQYLTVRDANDVELFATAVTGLNPTNIGVWVGPVLPRSTPIRVFSAESYNLLFLAQDEEDVSLRRATQVITYTAPSTFAVASLTGDLDGGGAQPILFRGVVRYLTYLFGWGFGTHSDPDRPEIVRCSLPGDPTNFDAQYYFIAGARGDPVLNCVPSHRSVMVFKGTEIHEITGTGQTDFGIQLLDPRYGLAGARLAVNVAETIYFWSQEGPRYVQGTITTFQRSDPSRDLGLPLDIGGPDPANLVASGEAANGWAHYIPELRTILFAFPNRDLGKTRVYALSIREPQQPRWSYFEWARAIWCAGTLYSVPGGPPTGYAQPTTLTVTGWYQLNLTWNNVGAIGDETVEVWFQDAAGLFGKVEEVPVSGASQSRTYVYPTPIFALGDTVTVALRYRRGTSYATGYDNPVTSGWSAGAITNSTKSVAIPAAPIADPTGTFEADCRTYLYGGKTYLQIKVGATITIDHGSLDIYLGSTNVFASASLAGRVAITGGLGSVVTSGWLGDWLITGVPPGTDHYYLWVQQRGPDGATSNPVAVAGDFPRDPTAGC